MCDLQGYKLSLPALCKDLVLEEDFELSPLYAKPLAEESTFSISVQSYRLAGVRPCLRQSLRALWPGSLLHLSVLLLMLPEMLRSIPQLSHTELNLVSAMAILFILPFTMPVHCVLCVLGFISYLMCMPFRMCIFIAVRNAVQ